MPRQLQQLVGRKDSPNNATCSKRRTEPLDSPPIDTQVGMANARGRTDRNKVGRCSKMKLEIVYKAEQSTRALGVEIVRGLLDHGRAGQTRDLLPKNAQGFVRRGGQCERVDSVGHIGCIA